MAQTLNMGDKDMEMTKRLNFMEKMLSTCSTPTVILLKIRLFINPETGNSNPMISDTVPMALPEELISITKKIPAPIRQPEVTTGP